MNLFRAKSWTNSGQVIPFLYNIIQTFDKHLDSVIYNFILIFVQYSQGLFFIIIILWQLLEILYLRKRG